MKAVTRDRDGAHECSQEEHTCNLDGDEVPGKQVRSQGCDMVRGQYIDWR